MAAVSDSLQQFGTSYLMFKEKIQKGDHEGVPFFLLRFFEKGPDHYLNKNLNCSIGLPGQRLGELSEERKAQLVLTALHLLFQDIMAKTARGSSCKFIIQPRIHDCNPYLINYRRVISDLLGPWLVELSLKLKFKEEQGLGAKNVKVHVYRTSQTISFLEMRSLL